LGVDDIRDSSVLKWFSAGASKLKPSDT